MDSPKELQLALWRESCRHIDIADSVSDLHAAMRPFIPVARFWLFSIDRDRCELVGHVGGEVPRFTLTDHDAASIKRWTVRGGVSVVNPARAGRSLLRPLMPALSGESVVCGALMRDDVAEGVGVWGLDDGIDVSDRISTRIAGILEPLSVALDTSRRFHELENLRRAAEAERQYALRRAGRESLDDPIVGAEGGLRGVMERVEVVARSDVPVLILGETGSGKEVIARAIHDRSARADGPFLRVNCGAIPPDLIDSHLFGHEKGSFTGASDMRQGWFERSDGGTLFLDEVGELPLPAQVRLLRVLQEGTLERVGGQESIGVDCRIVAATHRDLAQMVRERAFREDLWYRLAVFPVVLPPLRERLEDLRTLAQHFAHRAAVRFGLPQFEIDDRDLALLGAYEWPGNVRELAAVIDRAALLGQGHRLALHAAMGSTVGGPISSASRPAPPTGIAPLEQAIRFYIEAALRECHGKVEGRGGAAELLRVNPNTLRSKMRKLGLNKASTGGTGQP